MKPSIVELPNNGHAPDNASIARHLREQADWLEEEGAEPVRNIYLVIEYADGSLHRNTCGAPCDKARSIGVLAMALHRAMNGEEG